MNEIFEHAPAKVNLALHVTGQRDDGYHLIDSLVAFTRAGDRVSVRNAAIDGFSITGPFAPGLDVQADNLVIRARDLLRQVCGLKTPPVAITLEKNLPVSSGIGGGSSDAAATLRALIRLWNLSIKPQDLAPSSLQLGADLPMCLAATTLVARGIGEKLEPVSGLPPMAMVLVNPGVPVSTPAVFRRLVRKDNAKLPPLPAELSFGTVSAWLTTGTRNDLEAGATSIAPQIADALASLRSEGADLARMSGSGATCFGLFPSQAAASRAAGNIAAAHPSWYVQATQVKEDAEDNAGN